MLIKELVKSFENSNFNVSLVSCNESINYFKFRCRFKVNNNNDYLSVIVNNNKIMSNENFLSISINNIFVLRNRKFNSLDDIKELLILSIIKMKEKNLLSKEDLEVINNKYELVNNIKTLVN